MRKLQLRRQAPRLFARKSPATAAPKKEWSLAGVIIQALGFLLQVATLVLGIIAYQHTIKPAFERDTLQASIESATKSKTAAMDALVGTVFAIDAGGPAQWSAYWNPFEYEPLDVSPEKLRSLWPNLKNIAFTRLYALKTETLKKQAPLLRQSDIDTEIELLINRLQDAPHDIWCELDPNAWSQAYTADFDVIRFDVMSCAETRVQAYIQQQRLKPPDTKFLAKIGVLGRIEKNFEAACSTDREQSLRMRYLKRWETVRNACAARFDAVLRIIRNEPLPPSAPIDLAPPVFTEAERGRLDRLAVPIPRNVDGFGPPLGPKALQPKKKARSQPRASSSKRVVAPQTVPKT